MASFTDQITKALKLLDPKVIKSRSRAALKKHRGLFEDDVAEYINSYSKINRSVEDMKGKLFPRRTIIDIGNGVRDTFRPIFANFQLLAFPHKIKQRRRKDGTLTSRRVLEQVYIGGNFKKKEHTFIEKGKGGNILALQRTDLLAKEKKGKKTPLYVPTHNPFEDWIENATNIDKATENYSRTVMIDLGKRLIRQMYRNVNKKVKFKVRS